MWEDASPDPSTPSFLSAKLRSPWIQTLDISAGITFLPRTLDGISLMGSLGSELLLRGHETLSMLLPILRSARLPEISQHDSQRICSQDALMPLLASLSASQPDSLPSCAPMCPPISLPASSSTCV